MSNVITLNPVSSLELTDLMENSQNALLVMATPVLELILQLKAGLIAPSSDLRVTFDKLLKEMEFKGSQVSYPSQRIQSAKFALAAFIDETVLTADFPLRQEWEKSPLQLEYFGEHLAGVKFFERLEELLKESLQNLDVIEVYYVCLLLGYKGRYKIYLEDQLKQVISNVAQHLERANRLIESSLSPHARANDQPKPVNDVGLPLWIKLTAALAFTFSIFIYIIFKLLLNNQLAAAKEQLLR